MAGDPLSDVALLRLMAAGATSAFGEFYDRYAACLFSLALRILRREPDPQHAAEQVLLVSLTELWHRCSQPDAIQPSLFGWTVQMVRVEALNRRTVLLLPGGDLLSSSVNVNVERQPRAQPFGQAGAAIELAYFDGLSLEQIASHMGQDQTTVKRAIANGMRELRRGKAERSAPPI